MIRFPAGYGDEIRLKQYVDYYQAGYGVNMRSPNDLLGGEPSGLYIDFLQNLYLLRSGGETRDRATDFITFSRASGATVVGPNGTIMWAGHNLVVNSAAPVTQTLTVVVDTVYTIECTGSGSVALSGAGSGTVSAGSPVTVTASTTSLVLTVSGSVTTMWAYRSGLGGMVPNPATGTSYYPTTSSIYNAPRLGFDPITRAPLGILIEEQRTNLLLNSATVATQSVTVTAVAHTLTFYGSGTVTLSGASTAGPLVGTGGYPNRATLTFTPTAGTLTLTVSGTVDFAQLEAGSFATSYIPTRGASGTRSADLASVATSSFPYSAAASTLVVSAAASPNGFFNYCELSASSSNFGLLLYQANTLDRAYVDNTFVSLGTSLPNVPKKLAIAYDGSNNGAVKNGGSVLSVGTTVSAPAIKLSIGSSFTGGSVFNGHIRQITYIPRRVSNAELQSRTA